MARLMQLKDAIAEFIKDGDTISMEGFTHLIPFAAGYEVIRQGIKGLTLIRMTPDIIYDQLIGMGCAKKLIFSWGGNPGVGSLHRLRDSVERDWPHRLELEEHSHADMAGAYAAGASGLPFAILRGHIGTSLPDYNHAIKRISCPFTGEQLAAVPAIKPDVTVIHAQRADKKGNVHMWGIVGVQKEAVLAAKNSIVTVEEIVDKLDTKPNDIVLPGWVISAVCEVPKGSRPSYAADFYKRDNAFYSSWDKIARDRDVFQSWIKKHVTNVNEYAETCRLIEETGNA